MRPPRPSEGDRAPHHAPTRILSPSKSLRTKCLWALKETGCPPIKIEIPRKSPKSLKSLYGAAFAYAGLALYEASGELSFREVAIAEYDWIEAHRATTIKMTH
jgi:hypothetical protein